MMSLIRIHKINITINSSNCVYTADGLILLEQLKPATDGAIIPAGETSATSNQCSKIEPLMRQIVSTVV